MVSAKVDQRREAGLRTRARLMDAALGLLAERGEEGVSLREITSAADANVAAVSYHFGSLKALCDAAVEQALERYLAAQQEAVGVALSHPVKGAGPRQVDAYALVLDPVELVSDVGRLASSRSVARNAAADARRSGSSMERLTRLPPAF